MGVRANALTPISFAKSAIFSPMSEDQDLRNVQAFLRKYKIRKHRIRALKREKLKELEKEHPFTPKETLRLKAKEWAKMSLEAMEQLVHRDG